YGRKVVEMHIPRLLTVADSEAKCFGCNAVVVGKMVIVNAGCEQLMAGLQRWGYQTVALELDEFLKAGGSAKCLTLRLDGEDAAEGSTRPLAARAHSPQREQGHVDVCPCSRCGLGALAASGQLTTIDRRADTAAGSAGWRASPRRQTPPPRSAARTPS